MHGKKIEWTPEKLETLKNNYYEKSTIELLKILNIGRNTLFVKIRELKLTDKTKHFSKGYKPKGKSSYEWTQEQLDILKTNYGKVSQIELAKMLNMKSYGLIHNKLTELRLYKPKTIEPYKNKLLPFKGKSGIYILFNITKNICYIGSSNNIGLRMSYHICQLGKNKHKNSRMQADWNSGDIFDVDVYKETNDVLEACIIEDIVIQTWDNIYNIKNYSKDYTKLINNISLDRITKNGECILWAGEIKDGYGVIRKTIDGKKERFSVHKVAWVLKHNRNVPNNIKICHTCDNRHCINTEHMFLGTDEDNARDRENKGRGRKSKYLKQVQNLKQEGYTDADIARKLEISPGTVCYIVKNLL